MNLKPTCLWCNSASYFARYLFIKRCPNCCHSFGHWRVTSLFELIPDISGSLSLFNLQRYEEKKYQAIKEPDNLPFCCVFVPRFAIGELATIANRKKVAIRTDFLFPDSWNSFNTVIWSGRAFAAPQSALQRGPSIASWAASQWLPWAPPCPPNKKAAPNWVPLC